MARAMLGLWEEAARDLHVASKLDFDEEIGLMLKTVNYTEKLATANMWWFQAELTFSWFLIKKLFRLNPMQRKLKSTTGNMNACAKRRGWGKSSLRGRDVKWVLTFLLSTYILLHLVVYHPKELNSFQYRVWNLINSSSHISKHKTFPVSFVTFSSSKWVIPFFGSCCRMLKLRLFSKTVCLLTYVRLVSRC